MLPLQRLVSAFVITVIAALPLSSHAQEPAARQILGKWRHVSFERVFDGRAAPSQTSDGKGGIEYFANGTWIARSPTNVSGGTYRWLDGRRMEQTVLESGLVIQVGIVSVKEIRVSAKTLEIITRQTRAEMDKFMPPQKEGVVRPNEAVVTSVFARES
jgi:hypothetical protein